MKLDLTGRFVIVRSSNEGVNSGYVVEMDETGIIISNARRLWAHAPKDKSMGWYEGVSISGLGEGSKVSAAVEMKVIIETYSVTTCSPEAEESILNYPTAPQT